jgi:hypothetical protein
LLLLKRKSFPPSFRFKAKITNQSEAKNLKRKKRKKAEKSEKIDLNFPLRFVSLEVKITKAKRSKKFEAKNLKQK